MPNHLLPFDCVDQLRPPWWSQLIDATQALGPALKPFGILAHIDSSHPKFGTPLTEGEGTGDDVLVLLDRGKREAQKTEERRAKVKVSGLTL